MSGEEPKTGHADLSTKHDAASLCTIISTTSSESKVRNSSIDYTMSSTYKLQQTPLPSYSKLMGGKGSFLESTRIPDLWDT